MKILAIETSCDETAVTLLEANGSDTEAHFTILGNALLSQVDIHREYGGVFPMIAKREHARNLVAQLSLALEEAGIVGENTSSLPEETEQEITELLNREDGLASALIAFLKTLPRPGIDVIAVTHGPGLEPALWVGINFARALSLAWNIPVIGVNHMEGHLLSALTTPDSNDPSSFSISNVAAPVLGLLISGGHTELVSMRDWLSYELVGQTKDDAVGEAFDKVARMLDLPYPGGPEVSRLAENARSAGVAETPALPRPMLGDSTCDFSFSGLKTAVLYQVRDKSLTDSEKEAMALAFEDAVGDVLFGKASRALTTTGAQTLVLGGGVSANTHIRRVFTERIAKEHPEVTLRIPEARFTTDNAIMIGIAGFYRALRKEHSEISEMRAEGNLALTKSVE